MHSTELTSFMSGDYAGIALTVFLLGVRHGLDADHLAAIDGMVRFNAGERRRLARNAGVLFSLGHGVVVMVTALAVSAMTQAWAVPPWVEATGAWISIVVLILLALLNIGSVLRQPNVAVIRVRGWRSRWFSKLFDAGTPAMVAGVGALFAMSYDTLSQAALFGLTSTRFGGWQSAVVLALLFIAGMLLTDGLNGYWVARLVAKADRTAAIASRVMALAVAGVSLVTAAFGIGTQLLPASHPLMADRSVWFSAAILVVIAFSFFVAQRLARVADGGGEVAGFRKTAQ